jgi:hypothetical protein
MVLRAHCFLEETVSAIPPCRLLKVAVAVLVLAQMV